MQEQLLHAPVGGLGGVDLVFRGAGELVRAGELLEVAPGVTLIASGYLPEAYLPIATSHEKALGILKASDINWTYFSPAGYFEAGERFGLLFFRATGRNPCDFHLWQARNF